MDEGRIGVQFLAEARVFFKFSSYGVHLASYSKL
jgi:hypothetical protein